MWLIWLVLAIVVGTILLGWFLVAVMFVAGDHLCPRCGRSLEITDRSAIRRHQSPQSLPPLWLAPVA